MKIGVAGDSPSAVADGGPETIPVAIPLSGGPGFEGFPLNALTLIALK